MSWKRLNGKIIIEGNKEELDFAEDVLWNATKLCESGCYRGEGDWECENCWINSWGKEEKINSERKKIKGKTVILDFDGVIHKGYKGYKDGTIYGEIDKKLVEWIKELRSKGVHVCIMSNRDSKQIVEFMNKWCEENKVGLRFMKTGELFWDSCGSSDLVGVTNRKVAGILYVDDKGYRYEGVEKLKEDFDKMFES